MRRKLNELIQIERDLLEAAISLGDRGTDPFWGFLIAREMQNGRGARHLIGHGTLYKALNRLEEGGYLQSEWEDAAIAEADRRPRRRLYSITPRGHTAVQHQPTLRVVPTPTLAWNGGPA